MVTWEGNVDTDARNPLNYSNNQRPGANDELKFNNDALKDFALDAEKSLTVGKLTVEANFTKEISVKGALTLQFGNVAGDSIWRSSQRLFVDEDGSFDVKGDGALIFRDGGIVPGENGFGDVRLYDEARLELKEDATVLTTKLTVGDGETTGKVTLSDLNQNVLASGSTILVTSTGTFEMLQSGPSSTSRGGLIQSVLTTGTFTNQGLFRRAGATTGSYTPALDFVITNTGTIKVEANSNLRFTRKDDDNYSVINNSTGTVEIYYGSTVTVASGGKYRQNGGVFQTKGDPVTGAGTVFFYANSEFAGGSLYVNRDGTFGTLEFGNNDLTFSGPVVIYLKLDGSSSTAVPGGDAIYVSGAATLTIDNSGANKPKLNLETRNATPPKDWAYDVIWAPNLVGEFNTIQEQVANKPELGYLVSYPATDPPKVRVTSRGADEGGNSGGGLD